MHLFYRNQPVEFKNFRICFWNVSINILKDNASKVLTLNRNEIKSEYKSNLRITIKTAILRELLKKYDDFEFINSLGQNILVDFEKEVQKIKEPLNKLFHEKKYLEYIGYFQVITPIRKSEFGVDELNIFIQNILNTESKCNKIEFNNKEIKVHDKVMHLQNRIMKTTKNKAFGKNKFYNFYINKKENEYFFIFPVVGFSNSKNISWDIKMSSFFIAWGRSFIQLNLFEVVKDSNLDVSSNIVAQLEKVLITMKLKITDKEMMLEFLGRNAHLVTILKNANLNHHYVKSLLGQYLQGQSFIEEV